MIKIRLEFAEEVPPFGHVMISFRSFCRSYRMVGRFRKRRGIKRKR